jgi:DNA-binding IclR family transcriptional regulator
LTHGRLSDDVTEMRGGNARGGIQALDAALQLLKAMATFDTPASLTDLARAAGMPASKAHRYLASFAHAGLVVQERRSGLYDLGPGAAQFGLAALARNAFVNRASDRLGDLTSETGLTALLVVWGDLGATVVRWQRAPTIFITSLGLGTTMPLLNSASGRVFLAFLPKHITADRLRQEVERAASDGILIPDCDYTPTSITSLVARIRADGVAAIDGRFIPGLNAISAPILNWQEEAEAAVTLIGTRRDIIAVDGQIAQHLRDFVRSISIVRSLENR